MILPALLLLLAAAPQDSFENATPLVTVEGRGSQIYTCTASGWSAPTPEAVLYDNNGKQVGQHTIGPTWIWKDQSAVNGIVVKKTPAPDPAADIPWLLLTTKGDPNGSGFLSQVKWVQRTKTHGGVAPATGCDAAHLDLQVRVPYKASYTFYQ